MTDEKIARINELAKLAKERALTEAERAERAALRAEYLAGWRKATEAVLDNTYVDDGCGNVRKLKRKND